MKLYKTIHGNYVNLKNANYILVSQDLEDSNFKDLAVYAILGVHPGYLNEGIVLKNGFKTIEQAQEFIDELAGK